MNTYVMKLAATAAVAFAVALAGCPKPAPKGTTPDGDKKKDSGPPLGAGSTEVEVTGPGGATGATMGAPKAKESPPPPGPVHDAKFPPLVTTKLKNGLEVITVENHELPV